MEQSVVPEKTGQTADEFQLEARRPPPQDPLVKCLKCRDLLYVKEWRKHFKVCLQCGYHFRLSAQERIALLLDEGSFSELESNLHPVDPFNFVSSSQSYLLRLHEERERVGVDEAVIIGTGAIEGLPLVLAVMELAFMGGSIGSVVGEKVTRAIERALSEGSAFLLVSAASEGLRIQEGLFSLLQIAKISSTLVRLGEAQIPFISLLTDPTIGEVLAIAIRSDAILAEPGTQINFGDPHMIEQSMPEYLPSAFNSAESALAHGMLDAVVPRHMLRSTLARLLRMYTEGGR